MPAVRRRKAAEPHRTPDTKTPSEAEEEVEEEEVDNKKKAHKKEEEKPKKGGKPKWSCVDSCCWLVGCICITWWVLLFLYNALPASIPQYVTEAIAGPSPDPPAVKLAKEGLYAKHPVVFVPGIVTAGLELWEGRQCADGLFRKRLWGGTFGEVYKRFGGNLECGGQYFYRMVVACENF